MKNLPLILETPNFDKTEIWKREIGMLNNVCELDEGVLFNEGVGERLVKELREVVGSAEGKNGKVKAAKAPKKKRLKKGEDEQVDEDE